MPIILTNATLYMRMLSYFQDEPAMKATFAVTLIVQQDLQALSNMPELSCTHMSNGKKKVVFDVTPVMSTYLLAFAVGVWDVICDKTRYGQQSAEVTLSVTDYVV